ncbi:MAG: DsbA family protein [Mycobacterium sp.]|nr:DsbA family protein [Mycobacterium sp.]
MANKPKYDLKAADRKRNLFVQIGLTSVVVLFAVALVLYIVLSGETKPEAGEARSVRIESSNIVKKDDGIEPKLVLSVYEDPLCPHCGAFEKAFAPTINKLIDSGAIAVDYYMVGILNSASNQNYSSRAGGAAYCVADESTEAFRRFHAALYAQQPSEAGSTYPTNAQLIETARQAGASGTVPECIDKGRYVEMASGMAEATGINATPAVRINGEDYQYSTPEELVVKVKEIVGDLPGLPAAS